MPNPLSKSPAQDLQWLSAKVWEQILASNTTAFLAAYGAGIRAERWGSALRWISSAPLVTPPPSPPPSFSWQPTTILFQEDLNPTATFLLGETFQQEVNELGLHYAIDLSPNISPGLFPDQRENRLHLKSLRPARLLNLFAHTCAFGVLAASVGAETLNIDSSSRSLARGKANYQLNHLGRSTHRFWTEDVRRVLPRLARRGETFDAIILDPPTFAHGGRGRAFRIHRELEPLLLACLPLLTPRGSLLLSINQAETTPTNLHSMVREILQREAFPAQILPGHRPQDIPPERMPSTLWIVRQD
jgi:23S rRNA G2069 N7-methylase RlmK/C1962 C5-methylase RlmI